MDNVELFFFLLTCVGEHLIIDYLTGQLTGECHQVVNHALGWAFRAADQHLVLIVDILLLVTHLIKKYQIFRVDCCFRTRVEDKE